MSKKYPYWKASSHFFLCIFWSFIGLKNHVRWWRSEVVIKVIYTIWKVLSNLSKQTYFMNISSEYEPMSYLCKKPSIWSCFHNLWMQGISFFKFLLINLKKTWFEWLHGVASLVVTKTSYEINTIQNAKQIVSLHSDWEFNGNKEKLGYEKEKRLWLQTYELILGIGDGFCLRHVLWLESHIPFWVHKVELILESSSCFGSNSFQD